MVVDISDILLEVGSSKDFEGNVIIEDIVYQGEDIRFKGPFYIKGNLVNGGETVVLNGHLDGVATLICGMCTEPYDYLVDYDIQVSLKSLPDKEDPDIYVYTDDLIDINEVIIREFLLRLPMKRRCSEECRGLCPYCGINLNEDECQCSDEDHEPIDSRLEVLKDLFDNRDREV